MTHRLSPSYLTQHPNGVLLKVKVKTNHSRKGILEVKSGYVTIGLQSPPVEGKANTELIKMLAKLFDLPQCFVEILQGKESRQKMILLWNQDMESVHSRLLSLLK